MNFESGGKPTAKILTVWNILLKSGILMTVPSSNTGFDNSPRATPATIAIRYGNKLPYFAMISNILYLLLFFSQNGEKLKNASNNVPASVATGAVISWLPSDNCPCNTVIGAAIRIPPLIEFGTPFVCQFRNSHKYKYKCDQKLQRDHCLYSVWSLFEPI